VIVTRLPGPLRREPAVLVVRSLVQSVIAVLLILGLLPALLTAAH
jgi:hypothetical protein